jgi:hypothetical protein
VAGEEATGFMASPTKAAAAGTTPSLLLPSNFYFKFAPHNHGNTNYATYSTVKDVP